MMRRFEALEIWQLAHALALRVYQASMSFPSEERFGLTNQLRRAAASVGANIAEGYGRHNTQDTIHFLYIARGSLMETKNFLLLSRDLSFVEAANASRLLAEADRLSVKLSNTIAALTRTRTVREPVVEYNTFDDFITTSSRERSDPITTSSPDTIKETTQ